MQYFFIVLIISFVLFLYKLYHLADDDQILIKKNITVRDVFNSTLLVFFGSLLAARFFYVLFYPESVFFEVLGFLIFPYYPGLSLSGGIVGAILLLFLYSKYKKFPISRIYDFYSMALVFVLPFGWLSFMVFSSTYTIGALVRLIFYILLFVGFNYYICPKSLNLEIKDGTKGILFLMFFATISLLGNAIDGPGVGAFLANKENFLLIILLISSFVLISKQELIDRINFKNAK